MLLAYYYYCYYYYYHHHYYFIVSASADILQLPRFPISWSQRLFVEYLRQFLIDLNQTYRHSSVPQNTSP